MQENKLKQYTLVAMAVLVVGVIVCAIAGGGGKSTIDNADVSSTDNGDNLGTEEVAMTETEEPMVEESAAEEPAAEESTAKAAPTDDSPLVMLLTDDTIRSRNSFDSHLDSMPNGGQRLKINRLAGGLSRSLNDSNYLHIAVAEKIGIKPLTNLRAAWEAGAFAQLSGILPRQPHPLLPLPGAPRPQIAQRHRKCLPRLAQRPRWRQLSHKSYQRVAHPPLGEAVAPPQR
jgi:hypothetical protein